MLRDTHYYALALSQRTARECGVRCGVPFPACPQTRQARWLAAKERSNACVSPDHGSEGEDVQLRWRPAHEENSDEFPAIKRSRCSLRPNRTSSPGVSTAGPAGSAPTESITTNAVALHNTTHCHCQQPQSSAVHHYISDYIMHARAHVSPLNHKASIYIL